MFHNVRETRQRFAKLDDDDDDDDLQVEEDEEEEEEHNDNKDKQGAEEHDNKTRRQTRLLYTCNQTDANTEKKLHNICISNPVPDPKTDVGLTSPRHMSSLCTSLDK